MIIGGARGRPECFTGGHLWPAVVSPSPESYTRNGDGRVVYSTPLVMLPLVSQYIETQVLLDMVGPVHREFDCLQGGVTLHPLRPARASILCLS